MYFNVSGDDMDPFLKRSYESVLILSLLNPAVNNTEFQNEIKSRALTSYAYEFGKDELVSRAYSFVKVGSSEVQGSSEVIPKMYGYAFRGSYSVIIFCLPY